MWENLGHNLNFSSHIFYPKTACNSETNDKSIESSKNGHAISISARADILRVAIPILTHSYNPILNSLEDIFQGLGRRSLKYKGEASQANRQYSLGRFIVTEAYAPFVLFPWCVMMPASTKVT